MAFNYRTPTSQEKRESLRKATEAFNVADEDLENASTADMPEKKKARTLALHALEAAIYNAKNP